MILSYITNGGTNLIARSVGEGKPIVFTGASAGTGIISSQTKSAMMAKTALINPVTMHNIGVSNRKVDRSGNLIITVKFDNGTTAASTNVQELGTFAKIDGDSSSVLFSYTAFGTTPDVVPAHADVEVYRTYDMSYTFSGAETTQVTIDPDAFINSETLWSDLGKE